MKPEIARNILNNMRLKRMNKCLTDEYDKQMNQLELEALEMAITMVNCHKHYEHDLKKKCKCQ